jgi:hypothetical protein
MEQPLQTTLGVLAGGVVVGFAIVGGVAWLLRLFWKRSFGPPFVPAGILAFIHITGAPAGGLVLVAFALIDVLLALIWWQIFAYLDARAKGRTPVKF